MKLDKHGNLVEENAEDLARIEQDKVNWPVELQARETAENQKATDQANGNQKLLDLGLTQAEATALTGYTPPTEE